MSDPLTRRVGALANDTTSVIMPDGAAIRRRGERRTRRTALTVAAAVVAVLATGSAGAAILVDRRGAAPLPPAESPSPSASISASPTPSPTPSATPSYRTITSIPTSAMLQRADFTLNRVEPAGYSAGLLSDTPRLRLCGGTYPSDSLRTARREVAGSTGYQESPPPNLAALVTEPVEEQVNAYRSGGAAQFFSELRDQLNRCPGTVGEDRSRWVVVGTDLGGDESLLIEKKWLRRNPNDETSLSEAIHYVGVVRTGNLVIILVSTGWEIPSGSAGVVRHFMPLALNRVAALR